MTMGPLKIRKATGSGAPALRNLRNEDRVDTMVAAYTRDPTVWTEIEGCFEMPIALSQEIVESLQVSVVPEKRVESALALEHADDAPMLVDCMRYTVEPGGPNVDCVPISPPESRAHGMLECPLVELGITVRSYGRAIRGDVERDARAQFL